MPEHASETESDDETQPDGSEDHHRSHPDRSHEPTGSGRAAHCQFDDFAMI